MSKMPKITQDFIIDVETSCRAKIINRMQRLSWVQVIRDGGVYREDPDYAQIHLRAAKTESEVENWLYTTKGMNYVGVTVASHPLFDEECA